MPETARKFRGRGKRVRLATSIRPRENGRCPLEFKNSAYALYAGPREKNDRRAIS